MHALETLSYWLTIFLYAAVFGSQLFATVRERPGWIRSADLVQWVGFAAHTVAVVVRWVRGGHAPVTDSYELDLIGSWLTMLLFLIVLRARKVNPATGLVVLPICFTVLGHGLVNQSPAAPIGPAYQSLWLVVHVVFAWLAFGSFAIAAGASVLQLLHRHRPQARVLKRAPNREALSESNYRFVILGFICHAVMLVSGAVWARKLWGRYWSWDPLETWSLITFLYFAIWLHCYRTFDWQRERAAWMTVAGIIVMAISFWGVDWFAPTPHPGP
jgi:cytochrome c-type biogenesis protein CcsB